MTLGPIDERRSIAHRYAADDAASSSGAGKTAAPTANSRARDPIVDRAFARLDAAFEADLAAFATNATPRRIDGGILYVGFNSESERTELAALSKTGKVRALVETSGENDVFIGGVRYDFAQPGQIEAFVKTLGLDPRVADGVKEALTRADKGSREKLAQIAVVFAEAERGTPIPSRLVLSGHSGGLDLFGGRGSLALADLQRLARAMPRAAACIEDIHLSACSTSGQAGVDEERSAWRTAFPNLKTMWAYAGSSPMAPAHHLAAWGRATSGTHDSISVPKALASQHVAVWSQQDGYRDDVPLARLRSAQAKADTRFERFVSGALTAGHTGPNADPQDALADYQTYRVLSQKNELPPAERAAFAHKADQLLRIRYYEEGVRMEFAKRHGAEVRDGFAALGLRAPDFGTLSRADALAQIALFEQRLAAAQPVPAGAQAAAAALRGLRELDPNVIRTSDCHHR